MCASAPTDRACALAPALSAISEGPKRPWRGPATPPEAPRTSARLVEMSRASSERRKRPVAISDSPSGRLKEAELCPAVGSKGRGQTRPTTRSRRQTSPQMDSARLSIYRPLTLDRAGADESASSLARLAADSIARAMVLRSRPSSSVSRPAIVQPGTVSKLRGSGRTGRRGDRVFERGRVIAALQHEAAGALHRCRGQ